MIELKADTLKSGPDGRNLERSIAAKGTLQSGIGPKAGSDRLRTPLRRLLLMAFLAISALAADGVLPISSIIAAEKPMTGAGVVEPPATGQELLRFTDISLQPASQTVAMALGAEGAIWFAASALGALGRIDPATSEVTYFPLGTGARPHGLVEAEDRSILAVDRGLNVLHRLTPSSGDVTRIAMPAELPFLDLASIKLDRNGRVWFSGAAGWLGSHDLGSGQTEISSHEDLQGLTLAATTPNGSIWFVAGRAGRMIRFDPGRPRFDSTVLPRDLGGVRGLAVGPLGEVWLSAAKSPRLVRFGGRGVWFVAKMPTAESRPQALLARADGTLIVADAGRRKLVRYTPSSDRFDDIGDLGSGGNIKAMLDLGDAIAVADMGADRIRIFQDQRARQN